MYKLRSTVFISKARKSMADKAKRPFTARMIIPAVSLFFGLTIFFFTVTEVYLINPFEFNLDTPHALIPALLIALAASAVSFLLLILLNKLHPDAGKAGTLAVFGITLGGYIQNLLYNKKLGTIDGHVFDKWITLTYKNINWTVIVLIALTPLLVFVFTMKKPDSAAGKIIRSSKLITGISGTILLMQTVGCLSYVPNLMQESRKDNLGSYLSFAPARELSRESNTVVFLTDRMDCEYMDKMLELYPEVNDMLDGFTYYRNNISNFLFTYPSVPTMLTGVPYLGVEEHFDHFNRIWHAEDNALRRLHENGIRNYLILDDYTTYGTIDRLAGIADNIVKAEEAPHYRYFGEGGIFYTEWHLALLKSLPYLFKDGHQEGGHFDNFLKYDAAMPDYSTPFASVERDLAYHDYVFDTGLTADSPQKTFSFIHLDCAHDAEERLAKLYPDLKSDAYKMEYHSARGDFTTIERYMDELKRLGIYDCTTIIILGDHGRFPDEQDPTDPGELERAITTTLLIKPANAPHQPLQTDNECEMCNSYFTASILEYAGLDHSAYGLSFEDVIRERPHTERCLYLDFDMMPYYTINGDAQDFPDSWTYHPQK